MNPEPNKEETAEVATETHPVFTVTKTSKYLALALFVILPFIGGWIGYAYAPEKVVEVEKTVIKEVEVSNPINVGIPSSFIESPEALQNFIDESRKTLVLNQEFEMKGTYVTYEQEAWGLSEQCHGLSMRGAGQNFLHFKYLLSSLSGNSVNQIESRQLIINLPWEEIPDEDKKVIESAVSTTNPVTILLSEKRPGETAAPPCYSFFNYEGLAE